VRILELGSYVAPAYAGMILAEQGHDVEKWTLGSDPILSLERGDELWRWIMHGKSQRERHAAKVSEIVAGDFEIVIDNYRASAWARWGVDPAVEADRLGVTWVSLRADDDGRSFDVVAQARAWGDLGSLPFYIGDTAAGLWLAFKALAAARGHHVIRQATALAKLVEGELVAEWRLDEPWDLPGTFGFDDQGAIVEFKGEIIREPRRDAAWRREHLPNVEGRFIV
jgi:hypothetical protein